MKKLNHIWIFSDSISGHEIQSRALASKIANTNSLFHCGLRQPWLSFAPRILPRFGKNIIWEGQKPDIKNLPDAIVTCGRRMAAIGKHYKRFINCKHIQILNPSDNLNNYDIIICPEHDNLHAKNIIFSKGSLHTITALKLLPYKKPSDKKSLCILIGSPLNGFYNQLNELAEQIVKHYPTYELTICGSRRTPKKHYELIRIVFKNAKLCWLDEQDGENPYMNLLANSDIFLVTADSINMVSEACATDKTVITLAQNHISKKHKRFISSLHSRLSEFGTQDNHQKVPLDTMTHVAQQVLLMLKN